MSVRSACWACAISVMLFSRVAIAGWGGPQRALLDRAEGAYDRGLASMGASPAEARGAFTESAAAYRALTEDMGVHNARLLANLGNASLLAGDVGRAVLSYRRAARIDPADPTVRAGLAMARSRVGIAVEPAGRFVGPMGWLSGWTAVVRARTVLAGGVLAWTLGWGLLAAGRVRPGMGRARPYAWGAIVLGAGCIGLLVVEDAVWRRSPEAVLISDGVVGRSGPEGAAYAPSFDKPLAAGVEVTIEEDRGGWLRVRLADGRETWVPRSAVERVWHD